MCGILGFLGKNRDAGRDLYQGLMQLQHRGQDAAGIFTYDPDTCQTGFFKGKGVVHDVFCGETIERLRGPWGIGHVRYATSGSGDVGEIQPQLIVCEGFSLSLAYNGNLVNYSILRKFLEDEGYTFSTASDTEIFSTLFIRDLKIGDDPFEGLCRAVEKLMDAIEGAYSVVGLIPGRGLFAFRDPRGIRPLVKGVDREGGIAFSSETYPLTFLGFEDCTDIPPGELVFVDCEGEVQRRQLRCQPHSHCSFEYAYFSKGNAVLEGKDVYQARSRLGTLLAKKARDLGLQPDVVVGIPNTSQPAAMAVAWELGVRLEEGFLYKGGSGRSFIMPQQKEREKVVSQKLAPVASVLAGKKVLIVDDSIVRGTVSTKIVRMARQSGARQVYFASTFPPLRYPCFYGVDMPKKKELVAHERSYREIEEKIGADCVLYNSVEDLPRAIGHAYLCLACQTGDFPTSTKGWEALEAYRNSKFEAEKQELVNVGS